MQHFRQMLQRYDFWVIPVFSYSLILSFIVVKFCVLISMPHWHSVITAVLMILTRWTVLVGSTQEAIAWRWDWCHLLRGTSWPRVSAQPQSYPSWCQSRQHSAVRQRRRQTWLVAAADVITDVLCRVIQNTGLCVSVFIADGCSIRCIDTRQQGEHPVCKDLPQLSLRFFVGGTGPTWSKQQLSGEILAWLSVWSEVQVICTMHMVQLMPLPTSHLLLQWNPEWFTSGASLPRLSWKKGR